MKHLLFIIISFFLLLANSYGQTVAIDWEENYGGTSSDALNSTFLLVAQKSLHE